MYPTYFNVFILRSAPPSKHDHHHDYHHYHLLSNHVGFTNGSEVKNLPAKQEAWVWSLELERSPGGGNGNPLQYSCLENFMNRGSWWGTVRGAEKCCAGLSTHACCRAFKHPWIYYVLIKYPIRCHLSCGLCCLISYSLILFYPASQMIFLKSEFDHITYANDFNVSFIYY